MTTWLEPNTASWAECGSRLRIGEAARRFGLSPSALRQYERAGLITFQRSAGGHRYLDGEGLQRHGEIVQRRRIEGLSLPAIRGVLSTTQAADPPPEARGGTGAAIGRRLRALRL